MQQIYNVCPILDNPNFQNILKKFEMIGPINIDKIENNRKPKFHSIKTNLRLALFKILENKKTVN